jgi:ribonuclease Z
VPSATRDNTYFVLQGQREVILIDCGGSPLQKLQRVGIPLDALTHVVLTHRHPDHVYGLPALLLSLWVYGRQEPLHLWGLADTFDTVHGVMDIFGWKDWKGLFHVEFHEANPNDRAELLDTPDFHIESVPVCHLVPTIGLRVQAKDSGKTAAYSSDTEPCPALVDLARGVDLLIHESTGQGVELTGHSTASQAGAVAREAGAKRLVLVHLPAVGGNLEAIQREAEASFGGPVELARDFAVYEL